MTVRKFIGRCVLPISLGVTLCATQVVAQEAVTPGQQSVVDSASLHWAEELRQQRLGGEGVDEGLVSGADRGELDEQIFNEISPLIDSPNAVRLPQDQQPAE